MNKVILTGNLVRELELRKTPNGVSVANGTIAVKGDAKNQNGEYDTHFIDFVVWKHQADYLSQYAKKGDRLEIVGRWNTRTYTDQNGNNRKVDEVVIESASCFSKKKQEETQEFDGVEVEDDELPF